MDLERVREIVDKYHEIKRIYDDAAAQLAAYYAALAPRTYTSGSTTCITSYPVRWPLRDYGNTTASWNRFYRQDSTTYGG